jgi:hypothetical protein
MNEWEMGMPFDDRSEEIILAEMTGFKWLPKQLHRFLILLMTNNPSNPKAYLGGIFNFIVFTFY